MQFVQVQNRDELLAIRQKTAGCRSRKLPGQLLKFALTAIPIKVPHISSLQRLAGHSPSVLPQVRPKTLIPDSLPHSPCREQQSGQTLAVSQSMAVVSPKSQGASLPTANSTFSHERLCNRQQESSSLPSSVPSTSTASVSQGVAYAIISAASPPAHGVSGVTEAIKVQPLIFSPDSKVIIIQPQIPSNSKSSPASQTNSPVKKPSPHPSTPYKNEEDPEVHSQPVSTVRKKKIQSKRQERKRRSTANPAYSGLFEPERKRLASNYLNSAMFLSARGKIDFYFCQHNGVGHDDHCAVCKQEGDLQPCHTCTRAYHPDCLHPPLKTATRGMWMCPKCQKKVYEDENDDDEYVCVCAVREEERRKLMRRNTELKLECEHLSEEDKRLYDSLSNCIELKERLLGQKRETQTSLEHLKTLIRLIQRDQMIQVTMTATTTTGASLLSLPWIKATVLHKTTLQPQGNN
uniref:PHD finger protein 21B n=1 Tax=Sinocyclocheilus anshuiensis TaxID=1608454 RepID=A0A671KZJ8_9TELE